MPVPVGGPRGEVQQRQRTGAHHRRQRRPHQVHGVRVLHVQGHLEEVHNHHRDDDLTNLLLQIVDAGHSQPAELLQFRVAYFTLSVASGEEELVRSEGRDMKRNRETERSR